MNDRNINAGKVINKILCIEIVADKAALRKKFDNLHWTLSVYSLENKPAGGSLAQRQGVTFHFMVYDWGRTIKRLLENNQVPYTITRYFSPQSIFESANDTIKFSEVDGELALINLTQWDQSADSRRSALCDDTHNVSSAFLFEQSES